MAAAASFLLAATWIDAGKFSRRLRAIACALRSLHSCCDQRIRIEHGTELRAVVKHWGQSNAHSFLQSVPANWSYSTVQLGRPRSAARQGTLEISECDGRVCSSATTRLLCAIPCCLRALGYEAKVRFYFEPAGDRLASARGGEIAARGSRLRVGSVQSLVKLSRSSFVVGLGLERVSCT